MYVELAQQPILYHQETAFYVLNHRIVKHAVQITFVQFAFLLILSLTQFVIFVM